MSKPLTGWNGAGDGFGGDGGAGAGVGWTTSTGQLAGSPGQLVDVGLGGSGSPIGGLLGAEAVEADARCGASRAAFSDKLARRLASAAVPAGGADAHWPGNDGALLVIAPVVALYALSLVAVLRRSAPRPTSPAPELQTAER